jgi:hypothetical protein
MFRVIVLGGIALSTAAAAAEGCGGSVSTTSSDAGFPHEGPPLEDGSIDAFPQETAPPPDAFPQEGPPFVESGADGADAADTGSDVWFPHEGPQMIEAGVDAHTDADGGTGVDAFPQEGPPPQVDP